MRLIGARASDWHAGRPDIRPGRWLGAFLCVLVLYVIVAAVLGHVSNGDGSPFLGLGH